MESDSVGVQEEALERGLPIHLRRSAIEAVSGHRVPDARQVNSNLVRAAGSDPHLQESESLVALQHAVFGDCRPAAAQPRRHADAPDRIAGDGLLDLAAFGLDRAVHQREVDLLHLPPGELFGQAPVRQVVARRQDHAAGIAVQTVHDARPQVASQPG